MKSINNLKTCINCRTFKPPEDYGFKKKDIYYKTCTRCRNLKKDYNQKVREERKIIKNHSPLVSSLKLLFD